MTATSKGTAGLFVAALAGSWSAIAAAPAASIDPKEQLCASCHGGDGLPSDHTVPIIRGQQSTYLKKQLNDYRNGDRNSEIMSSIAESLSAAEVSEIAADFGAAKWPQQPRTRLPAAPAAIATCKACHDPQLTGGTSAAGVAPRLAGQFSAYLADTMTAYANGERANSSVMGALMQNLSPADRQAIAEYLAALR